MIEITPELLVKRAKEELLNIINSNPFGNTAEKIKAIKIVLDVYGKYDPSKLDEADKLLLSRIAGL